MKSYLGVMLILAFSTAGCSKQDKHHPWVEPGMSREQVRDLMGSPIKVDSVYHQYDFDLGSVTAESLDSLRRTLDESLAKKMTLGRPVDHSSRSDQYTSWYYGPVITDTMFTIDRKGPASNDFTKVWYESKKQRIVVFDNKTGTVRERGFNVLQISVLPQVPD